MITVIIGTKGQFIKMAPILIELEKRGFDYNFINAKQHTKSLDKMINLFNIKKPDDEMWNYDKDITNIKEIFNWLVINSLKYTIGSKRKAIKNNNSKNKNIILVHGDAPPVLLGLLLGKFHNIDLGHVEAGCRSNDYLAPFPEEIIRVIADKLCKVLFPLSDFATVNVINKYKSKLIFPMKRNTPFDTVRIAINNPQELLEKSFVLTSIHRFETIQSHKKMKFIADLLTRISKDEKIIFPLHESTKRSFEKYKLYHFIENNSNIHITSLMDYFTFISHINNAKYIITDGGGPQEESYYLGTPTLLLRDVSERIWDNNCLAGFDIKKINNFLDDSEKYRTKFQINKYSPSKLIVDILERLGYAD